MNPTTTVTNIRTQIYDVYIGRAGKGKSGYFGNPFSLGTREENIANFKIYFYKRIAEDNEFKKRVLELEGKKLGCFCKPLACHGDIIVEYLNNLKLV